MKPKARKRQQAILHKDGNLLLQQATDQEISIQAISQPILPTPVPGSLQLSSNEILQSLLLETLPAQSSSSGLILSGANQELFSRLATLGMSLLLTEKTSNVALPSLPDSLEAPCRLSRSKLWDLQDAFYSGAGVEAWKASDGVPSFITSSTYMGESYAELILAFLEDYAPRLNLEEPVYILELASGSGRFAYMTLCELFEKLPYFEKFKNLQLKFVMTDFAERNCRFWQEHPQFQPFVESGMLDFAIYNPLQDTTLTLRHSQTMITPKTQGNPLIVLANYFFDTIRHDYFRVSGGLLQEGLVQLHLKEGIPAPAEGTMPSIDDVELALQYRLASPENYYAQPAYNALLKAYEADLSSQISGSSLIFPIGALEVLDRLQTLTTSGLVLLSSDKAYTNLAALTRPARHNFSAHGGSFSFMMNYEAIGRYFQNKGGHSLATQNDSWNLQTFCGVQFPEGMSKLEHLQYVFSQKIQRINPINSLCTLMPTVNDTPEARIEYWLAYIRLQLNEPAVFCHIGETLLPYLTPLMRPDQKVELMSLMTQAWQRYYYHPGEKNMPFTFSQIYHAIGEMEMSLFALEQTSFWYGEHAALSYLKGEILIKLSRFEEAKASFKHSLLLNPEQIEAKNRLEEYS
jgi:tetratricopeptide (TPR) repeat protein